MKTKILVADDDAPIRESLAERFRARGHEIVTAADGRETLTRLRREKPDVVILDLQMPGLDGFGVLKAARDENLDATIVVVTAFGTIERAVQAMKEGAWDFLTKPFQPTVVDECVRRALERSLLRRNAAVQRRAPEIVGLAATVELARKVARSDATVLITGESGAGKDVLAQSIHAWSARGEGPFVALNAAAVPETLLESELFGHERGAFTGADKRRIGRFESAHGGTLFLDEIGDMPPAMQTRLLRVLETHELERVGGTETVSVDVRLIAATHRDLEKRVAEGQFRADLWYRLNVLPVHVPPLRERRGDVILLARHFLARLRPAWSVSTDAQRALEGYDWPGNARELRNVIERAVALSDGPEIALSDLPPEMSAGQSLAPTSFHGQVEAFRARLLKDTLARHGGNQTRAAEALGLQRTYLARLLRQMRMSSDTR